MLLSCFKLCIHLEHLKTELLLYESKVSSNLQKSLDSYYIQGQAMISEPQPLKAKTASNHCSGTLNLRRMIEDLGRCHLLCHSPWSFPGQTCGYFTSKFQTARVDKCSVSPAHSAHTSKFIFAPLGESQCYYPSVLYFLLDLFMLTSCSNGIV